MLAPTDHGAHHPSPDPSRSCVFLSFSLLFSLCFFGLLTLLSLSVAKSKIALGKCHTALENMWVILKYLLLLIFHIVPVIREQTV